jgi:hypothetical protein
MTWTGQTTAAIAAAPAITARMVAVSTSVPGSRWSRSSRSHPPASASSRQVFAARPPCPGGRSSHPQSRPGCCLDSRGSWRPNPGRRPVLGVAPAFRRAPCRLLSAPPGFRRPRLASAGLIRYRRSQAICASSSNRDASASDRKNSRYWLSTRASSGPSGRGLIDGGDGSVTVVGAVGVSPERLPPVASLLQAANANAHASAASAQGPRALRRRWMVHAIDRTPSDR